MTGLPLRLEVEAKLDFEQAANWYLAQVPGLSDDFAAEVDKTLQRLMLNPAQFPLAYRGENVRRVLIGRFPYKIFFRIDPDEIVVIGILHASQDDWILKRRLKNS
jgi:plasmid stabilization system protein ParE